MKKFCVCFFSLFVLLAHVHCQQVVICYEGDDARKFNNKLVQDQNAYRKKHDVPPLVVDESLMADSRQYTRTLVNLNDLIIRGGATFAQYIYNDTFQPADPLNITRLKPIQAWYTNNSKPEYGSMILKDTNDTFGDTTRKFHSMGCGVCTKWNTSTFIVCRYNYHDQTTTTEKPTTTPRPNPVCLKGDSANELNQRLLAEHNEIRIPRNAPPLRLNDTFDHAVKWAYVLALNGVKRPFNNTLFYGGNIYMDNLTGPINESALNPVNTWYRENSKSENLKKLIWKNSRSFACGACSGFNSTFLVCIYGPDLTPTSTSAPKTTITASSTTRAPSSTTTTPSSTTRTPSSITTTPSSTTTTPSSTTRTLNTTTTSSSTTTTPFSTKTTPFSTATTPTANPNHKEKWTMLDLLLCMLGLIILLLCLLLGIILFTYWYKKTISERCSEWRDL